MTSLDSAVQMLQEALDRLEERLSDRLHDLALQNDAVEAARRQARAARGAAGAASDRIADAIDDLKGLLEDAGPGADAGD
jgi:hypothetical protein